MILNGLIKGKHGACMRGRGCLQEEKLFVIKCGGKYVKFNLDGSMRGSKMYGATMTESYLRKLPFSVELAVASGIITIEEVPAISYK